MSSGFLTRTLELRPHISIAGALLLYSQEWTVDVSTKSSMGPVVEHNLKADIYVEILDTLCSDPSKSPGSFPCREQDCTNSRQLFCSGENALGRGQIRSTLYTLYCYPHDGYLANSILSTQIKQEFVLRFH